MRKKEPSTANIAFEGRNHQKIATNEEEKVLFHQDIALCHKPIVTMAKLHELHFELLPHPSYSPATTGCLQTSKEKRFGSNEEVISETEAYFEAKVKSFYKKSIDLLEKYWNQCITLEGDHIDE